MTTTIVLADDHKVVRQGLKALLEAERDFHVMGEASDGLEVVKLVENAKPDVLVVDLMMGGMNGLEVTRQVSKQLPHTGIIILSMYGNESYVIEALRAGARGYVLKESSSDELVRAVHEAAAGRRYLSSSLSDRAIETYVQKAKAIELDPYDSLTTREREVLHLVAQDHTSMEIAKQLCISRRTVEIHRANMMRKLNLRTKTDLIRFALRRGIVPGDTGPNEQETHASLVTSR